MSKARLSACPSCARHVRVSEPSCPFCGLSLDGAFRALPAPRAPAVRLGRAALYAFGAGTITVAAACSSPDPGEGGGQGTKDAGSDVQTVPLYGGPPVDGGPLLIDAAYGGPPVDAHEDTSPPLLDAAYGGPPVDAHEDSSPPLVDAAYGGPPIDSGHD